MIDFRFSAGSNRSHSIDSSSTCADFRTSDLADTFTAEQPLQQPRPGQPEVVISPGTLEEASEPRVVSIPQVIIEENPATPRPPTAEESNLQYYRNAP